MRHFTLSILLLVIFQNCKKKSLIEAVSDPVQEVYYNKDCNAYPFDTTSHIAYAAYIPNSFSPHDNWNAYFMPVFYTKGSEYNMKIYDQSNTLLFETTTLNEGWSGSTNRNNWFICPTGIYKYHIQIFEHCRGIYHRYTGSFLLI